MSAMNYQESKIRIEAAIQALKNRKCVILTDHPDREDEGDLIFAAEFSTPELMNFMLRNTSGIICMPILAEKANALNLPLMIPEENNSSSRQTPFTISIDARVGVTTGVSTEDRHHTILAACHEHAQPSDLVSPGHIFPLIAKNHGVLERPGHTEGSIDLMKLAGLKKVAILCELMNADGSMMRGEKLIAFSKQHDIPMLSIDDLILYRQVNEALLTFSKPANLPTEQHGEFTLFSVREIINQKEHIILTKANPENSALSNPPLVRIHSACATGDIFHSLRCDCAKQLNHALDCIQAEGGFLIYLNQEGRGTGIFNKVNAYALQETGMDTVDANLALGLPEDAREYGIVAQILKHFNLSKIRLLSNNPKKIDALQSFGIEVERQATPIFLNKKNQAYLQTKRNKLKHLIDQDQLENNHDAE